MSTETKATLDAALSAHFADECEGAMVTGYVLTISGVNTGNLEHGEHQYLAVVAERQAMHTSLGLHRYAMIRADSEIFDGDD